MGIRHEIDVQRLRSGKPRPRQPKEGAEDAAYRLRKTFMGEDLPPEAYVLRGRWSGLSFQWVGTCESVAYASNKWKGGKKFEEFKHVAESKQDLYAVKGAISGFRSPGPWWTPSADGVEEPVCAELAPLLFLQSRLFVDVDAKGNGVFGKGDEGCAEIHPSGCMLFATVLVDRRDRSGGEPALLVHHRTQGLQFLIVGQSLNVTRDGIVG